MAAAELKTMEELKKVTFEERCEYVLENRLCFNCLKTGHSSVACRAKNRCDQCHRKHHTLLHPSTTERKEQTPKRKNVVSAAIQSGATAVQRPQVFLMTAMAYIKTQQGHMQARVFLDQGAQASFVSAHLAQRIQAPRVGQSLIVLKGFGSQEETKMVPVKKLKNCAPSGDSYEIEALEKETLGLDIPQVPEETVQRWRARGITLSDAQSSAEERQCDSDWKKSMY